MQFEDIQAYSLAVTVEHDGRTQYVSGERVGDFKALQYDRMFGEGYLDCAAVADRR